MPGKDETSEQRLRALEAENSRLREALRRSYGRNDPPALSKREALLVEAERVAHLGSWTWDLRTDEIEWSDEFYRILGLEPGCVPPSADRFFASVHPDDRARVQADADASVAMGAPSATEFRLVRPSGEIRYVRLHAAPMTTGGEKPVQVVGVVLDLTEPRQAQAQLTRIVDELRHAQSVARLGSWVWDLESNRLEWSEGLYQLVGLNGNETPSAEFFDEFIHPDDLPLVRRARGELLERAASPPEFRVTDRSGNELVLRSEVQAIHDERGRISGFRGVLQDVTRQHELESQVRRAQKMEAVGRLAGGIAHDFNNYLMVISAHIEWLDRSEELPEEVLVSTRAIAQACERCAQLTSQLLTFSRKRASNPRTVDLSELIERVTPILHSVLGESIRLEVVTRAHPVYSRVDPSLLEQALINLVVNARDAMEGGGTVKLDLDVVIHGIREGDQRSSSGGVFSRLRISDTGHGIPPEHLSRIFEPFFTTKEVGRGTGLGLATAYGVVAESGGHIEVESEVGSGTTFSVLLPHTIAERTQQSSPQEPRPAPIRGGTILLVEDVDQVRQVLRRQLERAGFEIITACDGEEALAIMDEQSGRVDLVLSDVVMPRLGGVELEARLRERYPSVSCLLMTGHAEDALTNWDPALPLLRKPFSATELLRRIGELDAFAPR